MSLPPPARPADPDPGPRAARAASAAAARAQGTRGRLRAGRQAPGADARQGLPRPRHAPLVRRTTTASGIASTCPAAPASSSSSTRPGASGSPAFDHARLAAALSKADGQADRGRPAPDRLHPDRGRRQDPVRGRRHGLELRPGRRRRRPRPTPRSGPPSEPDPPRGRGGVPGRRQGSPRGADSPDGKWSAFVKDHDLYLRTRQAGEEFALGHDGTEGDAYEAGVFWSPDSKKLVALRTRKGDDRKVFLVESSPRDPAPAEALVLRLPQAGRQGPDLQASPVRRRGARSRSRSPTPSSTTPGASTRSAGRPTRRRFTFLYNQRGHQVLRLVAVDATTGEARALIEEQSPTFVDYSNKTFLHFLDKTDEILWMSERDGWNHLYLIDAQDRGRQEPGHAGGMAGPGGRPGRRGEAAGLVPGDGDRPRAGPLSRPLTPGSTSTGPSLVRLTEGDGNHTLRLLARPPVT